MKRVSQQGRALSAGQRRQLELQRLSRPGNAYAVTDFSALRDKLESRMFVGPPKPVELYQLPPLQESRNYWRMADEFSRYGFAEVRETGTPCIAEWMGF